MGMASQHIIRLTIGIFIVQRKYTDRVAQSMAIIRFLTERRSSQLLLEILKLWRDLLICTQNANWYYYYMEFMFPLCRNLPRNSRSWPTIDSINFIHSENTYNH
jgi:hypothetical protein